MRRPATTASRASTTSWVAWRSPTCGVGCFEYDAGLGKSVPCAVQPLLNEAEEISPATFAQTFSNVSRGAGGFRLDLLSVNSVLNMLSGKDFDLVSFNLPQVDID